MARGGATRLRGRDAAFLSNEIGRATAFQVIDGW
jgi:hypothetical protein